MSVVSSVNLNVTLALTVRKPSKPQPKPRRKTASLNDNEQAPQEQPGPSIVPDPQKQNEGLKRKRAQFYGFWEADISPTSSLGSTSSSRTKKRKTKKQERKNFSTEETVVELIQNAEQVQIPSPPRPDIQIGSISPPDPRIRYYEYKQEKEMSVRDAENEI